MRIEISSKALAGLFLLTTVLFVAAAADKITTANADGLEIETTDGNITLDPAESYVIVDGNVDATIVDTPLIQDAATIAVQPNGDPDDGLEIEVTGDLLFLKAAGSDLYLFEGDVGGIQIAATTNTAFMLASDGSQALNTTLQGDTVVLDPDGGDDELICDSGECKPQTDNSVTWGSVTGSNQRWSDVRSVLINGADICFENNICMTECVNDADQVDVCFVYGKPTADQRKSIGAAAFSDYSEYMASHMVDGVFDDSMGESEFNARKGNVTVDDKVDFTFSRTVRMTLRDVKNALDRLDVVELTLCGEGFTEHC